MHVEYLEADGLNPSELDLATCSVFYFSYCTVELINAEARERVNVERAKMAAMSYKPRCIVTSNSSNDTGDGAKANHINDRCQIVPEIRLVDSEANGYDIELTEGTNTAPLNIVIVGAGIGGLTAAIGLRRNGHNVSVSRMQPSFTEV
jgi:hypothetical protein